MKKITFLLIAIASLSNLYSQDLNGVWVSNDDPLRNGSTAYSRSEGGIIIDFDKNYMSTLASNTKNKISLNGKKTKIKAKGLKGKLKVQDLNQNSMVLLGSNNTLYTFKKLDLKHKIASSKKELSDFIISQHCDEIQGIKAQFTAEQFFLDKKSKKAHKRNQFINYSNRDNGYWYVKKVRDNALLVFTIGQNQPENIFHILKLSVNGLKLRQLQEDNKIKGLETLKTCL